jgi:transketolase
MDLNEIRKLDAIASEIRETCLKVAYAKNPRATHFGGAMSTIEILVALYFKVMKLKAKEPQWYERDRFFLSKGHSVLGYYSVLNRAGFLTDDDLWSYGEDGTAFPGHPLINKSKGIEFTNGSLGMGLSVAIGNAIAIKKLNLSSSCYVLLGDGECNEGSVWEAIMSAAHFKLGNVKVIVDRNHLQQTGASENVMNLGSLATKFSAFGWEVCEVDGHNIFELIQSLRKPLLDKPTVIIANTIKGKGFSFSENNNAFHHGVITKDLFALGLKEMGETNV